ncbi:MAG: N-acetyl-gamma-glutamyl-phosphate reductase [Firmicutes bacterium ADurb.Bin080]|nr:N-acetyl-gamma-glutamyl-phosphate reductase [Clostridiales bacterium]OQC15823.1 MAG: N-acetyl-gamma-glutamyl-phosphate reductase [Firmicutes bacterium ADurb.Bin080]
MKKVFIDGQYGTTGLSIYDRIKKMDHLTFLSVPEKDKKDPKVKKEVMNESDIVLMCLPDEAAIESVALIDNPNVRVIDTSTAHRTDPSWLYGFPELSPYLKAKLSLSSRISVPGCHASGFLSLIYPLTECGFLPKDALLSCTSITGYSGGGKKMIGEYVEEQENPIYLAPREYGLTQKHKHLKEMKYVAGLKKEPAFVPIVSNFYSGMVVSIPIFKEQLSPGIGLKEIKKLFSEKYTGPIVKYTENLGEEGYLSAAMMSGKDSMQVSVLGNEDRILLVSRFDNLGKGASGAAVQCMNLILGENETYGLNL